MKNIIKNVLMISLGLLLSLLFLEIALRLAGYSFPAFITMDENRGWSLWPNQEGWTQNEGGKIYLKINGSGLRDVEHIKKKPSNTLRVIVLGDSYTEAAHVQMEDTFWFIMSQHFSTCPLTKNKKVEVINLGVDGYGTDQELLTLREQAWSYGPDAVVLVFTPTNDVTDNSRTLSVDKDKPFFVYQGGKLVLDTSFKDSSAYHFRASRPMQWYYRLVNHSRSLQLLRQCKSLWRQRKLVAEVQGTADSGGITLGLADKSFLAPGDPVWRDAWQVTEALLREMNDEVKAKGAAFLVVTVTRAIQVSPDAQARRAYMQRLGVDNLFYPEQRISSIGKSSGFEVLNLAQLFLEYAAANNTVLHFPAGHWNVPGNRLAAKLISDRLCEILQSPDHPPATQN